MEKRSGTNVNKANKGDVAFVLAVVLLNCAIYLADKIVAYMTFAGTEGYISGHFDVWLISDISIAASRFGFNSAAVAAGEYYRLVTTIFLHSGIAHLAWNMLTLTITSFLFLRRFGKLPYLVCYLAGGIASSLALMLQVYGKPVVLTATGSSGAIFGLLGGCMASVFYMVLQVRRSSRQSNLTQSNTQQACKEALPLDLAQWSTLLAHLGFLLLMLAPGASGGVVNQGAHLGGLVAGFVLGLVFTVAGHRTPTRSRSQTPDM